MSAESINSPTPLAEISHGPSAFEQFLDKNQKNLIVLTVLLVLAAAGWVVYRGIAKSNEETAGAALNKAADLAALQAVKSEHAGTRAAGSAAVLLAEKQWSEGQQDAAIQTLKDFISTSAKHSAFLGAKASLAAKLMTQGKSADATALFQEIVEAPSGRYIKPYALISLGDIASVAGDPSKAEISYSRVKQDFADSGFGGTATERISALRAKPPVEVEPPPAAPAPDASATAPPANATAPAIIPVPESTQSSSEQTPPSSTEAAETPTNPEP